MYPIKKTNEYRGIARYYGDKTAARSGVRLMNHIDEGLLVLGAIGASLEAKLAYCIHPLFQDDAALIENLSDGQDISVGKHYQFTQPAMILVMEYRSVANEYLSKRTITSLDEIRLSPLGDVNNMLIADKVQNYKDFVLYHKDTHPRSVELDLYFNNWLTRLDVNDSVKHLLD